jgi:hypothetical protein
MFVRHYNDMLNKLSTVSAAVIWNVVLIEYLVHGGLYIDIDKS